MAYIGKNLVGVLKEQKSVSTLTGNGSITTLTLSDTPGSVNNVLVFFDGLRQQPVTDYSVDGTTLTFTTAPETGVIVTAIVGNHSGVNPKPNSITTSKLVDGSITADNIPSITGSQVTGLAASKLTGVFPAIDGSALTGVVTHTQVTKSASDPTFTTNPSDGLGTIWCNTTTGNMYVCTDATTNLNEWINMGKGTGDIINFAPTNYTDSFPDLSESASTNYTFSGASDPDGTVAHYLVEQISNPSLLAVTTAEMPNTQAHEFVTQSVDADTNVTFVVKTKDNLGKYSSGVTVTVTILNNVAPTNATNTASFADMNKNTSQNFTFSGATDTDGSVTHYMVDQISNAALTVSAAEVTDGSAHTFNAGAVASDTAVTFRVRAKDNDGTYSSGVTVSMTVLNIVYTTATGGAITTSGDYKIHTFDSSGTFAVSIIGTTATVEYLVIAGGGSGGWSIAAGGGAGGLRNSYNNETSGGGGSSESALTLQASAYTVTIGAGGVCTNLGSYTNNSFGRNGNDTTFAGAGISTVTSIGGGRGGSGDASSTYQGNGGNGGSGGGAGSAYGAGTYGQGNPGTGTANQGYAGGTMPPADNSYTGGGGGAGGVGKNWNVSNGEGGLGLQCNIDGNNYYYAGGGGSGGNANYGSDSGNGGIGGGGGGGNGVSSGLGTGGGSARNSGTNATTSLGGYGGLNTGSGGGGGGHYATGGQGGSGGSGIVIVRYKYQN
jgi:hypothetical protein